MVTLQLIQKPCLHSLFSIRPRPPILPSSTSTSPSTSSPAFNPRASSHNKSRRRLITETASATAISLIGSLVSQVPPQTQHAFAAEEPALSEWERVYLPIDPGVVLLDIGFVPDDPNHGPFRLPFILFILTLYYSFLFLILLKHFLHQLIWDE